MGTQDRDLPTVPPGRRARDASENRRAPGRRRRALVAVAGTLLVAAPVGAPRPHAQGALPPAFGWTAEQVGAASRLAAGHATAIACGRTVDTGAAERFVAQRLAGAADGRLTPEQAAGLMTMVAGLASAQKTLQSATPKPGGPLATYCAEAARNFGPGGSMIPGLFRE